MKNNIASLLKDILSTIIALQIAMSRQRLRLPTLLLISCALILQTSDKEVSARGSLVRDVSNTRFHQLKYLVIVELVISVSN